MGLVVLAWCVFGATAAYLAPHMNSNNGAYGLVIFPAGAAVMLFLLGSIGAGICAVVTTLATWKQIPSIVRVVGFLPPLVLWVSYFIVKRQ